MLPLKGRPNIKLIDTCGSWLIVSRQLLSIHSLNLQLIRTFFIIKGVRAHKIPCFSFSIEERGVLGEYVEVTVTRNIQFYVSTAIHHS